jgi:hypothetical protein
MNAINTRTPFAIIILAILLLVGEGCVIPTEFDCSNIQTKC